MSREIVEQPILVAKFIDKNYQLISAYKEFPDKEGRPLHYRLMVHQVCPHGHKEEKRWHGRVTCHQCHLARIEVQMEEGRVTHMCQAMERINKIQDLLRESLSHESQFGSKLSQCDQILSGIDHELEIKRLSAPHLAKVMRYRQQVLLERRDIKHQFTLVQIFNQMANAQKLLQITDSAFGAVQKRAKAQQSDTFIKDRGMIEHILGIDNVSKVQIISQGEIK